MCGIFGIFVPKGNTMNAGDQEAIDRGMVAIARRGPDGEGQWKNERVIFGHRRLAIIDPDPRSNQPMKSRNWVLCYNGEIYNFQSIRVELETLGQNFTTSSDTEVLLLSLEQWGIEGTLKRIAGMFAFVAYNLADGMTYVVRDHMGIKPLLYSTLADGRMFFSSSVAAILAARPGETMAHNPAALASYFVLGGTMTNETCYQGIHRLPAAHFMAISPTGDKTMRKFWEPQYQTNFTMDDVASIAAEYEISDVKSAMFLSGGVDSSYLATIYKDLDCFHLVSPEEPFARTVAARFDRNFVSVEPHLEDFENDVVNATVFHGEPMMSVGIPLAVSREISRKGYKMAISANGADELFHGYTRTPTPQYEPAYLPLHEEPSFSFLGQQLAHIFRDNRNFDIPSLGAQTPSLRDIGMNAMKNYQLPNFPASASHRWLELMTYVLSDLNPTLDAASMYNSVEVRVPFLDYRIVQGVLSWDASQLVTPTMGRKAPLKQHLSNYFPQSLYQRTKLGFSIHDDKLSEITDLSADALGSAVKHDFVHLKKGAQFGQYQRDMIYLGSSLFGHSKWLLGNNRIES